MEKKIKKRFALFLILAGFVSNAFAVLKIEITKGVQGATPIAVVPFVWNTTRPASGDPLEDVIAADLYRSGYFSPADRKDMIAQPSEGSQIRCQDWRMINVENVVVGSVQAVGDKYEVRYDLWDVLRCAAVSPQKILQVRASDLRQTAHQIADEVFEALTGVRGAFSTRIAYVTEKRTNARESRYELVVSDSDGYNPQSILRSKNAILSPAWSPDGQYLAYASFERAGYGAGIFIQNVSTSERYRLIETDDEVSAPAWSPDGRKLAVAMSRKGRRDIYIVDVDTRQTRRLTNVSSATFATEPAWSPDGRAIVYTLSLGGRGQIYRTVPEGGREERVSFAGKQNFEASYSPDGKSLALIHDDGNGNQNVAVQESATGAFRVLTNTNGDESPTFAPNGVMILYATRSKGRGVLAAVSVDGRVQIELGENTGDVREPAWGPYTR